MSSSAIKNPPEYQRGSIERTGHPRALADSAKESYDEMGKEGKDDGDGKRKQFGNACVKQYRSEKNGEDGHAEPSDQLFHEVLQEKNLKLFLLPLGMAVNEIGYSTQFIYSISEYARTLTITTILSVRPSTILYMKRHVVKGRKELLASFFSQRQTLRAVDDGCVWFLNFAQCRVPYSNHGLYTAISEEGRVWQAVVRYQARETDERLYEIPDECA